MWPDRCVDGSECTSSGHLAGKPLTAGRWSGVLLFLKGDLDFMCNDVGIPHWSRHDCCGRCLANKSDLNYKDLRRKAKWRPTVHTPESFRRRFGQAPRHPLLLFLAAAGGLFAWALDTLHVMDYNGISAHIIGSVLTDIIRDDEFRTGLQARSLELINERLSDYYRQYGIADRVVISMKVLNVESMTDYPFLGGRSFDARAGR